MRYWSSRRRRGSSGATGPSPAHAHRRPQEGDGVKIAMIGLDRMGTNMTERLVDVQATLEVCRHSPGMKATATPGNQVGVHTVRRP